MEDQGNDFVIGVPEITPAQISHLMPTRQPRRPVKQPKIAGRAEAVSKAVKDSGLQRSPSKGMKQAVREASASLSNDRMYRRPARDVLTMIDKDAVIPHLKAMSELLAHVTKVENRAYDSQQQDHWTAIFRELKKMMADPDEFHLDERPGDVFKQILRYELPRALQEQGIDLEETKFVVDGGTGIPKTRAQDLSMLIDHLTVVCQKLFLEGERYKNANIKLGRKNTLAGRVQKDDVSSNSDGERN